MTRQALPQGPLAESLETLRGLVTRAHGDIAAGAVVDLTPLEVRVHDLCQAISALPGQDGRRYRDALVALMDDLGALSRRVESGLEALSAELGTAGKRHSAVSAYGKGPGPSDGGR